VEIPWKRKRSYLHWAEGIKGYAHIGVISALEDLGYEIVGIAGTSAGGVFGSFYAYGYSIVEILSFIHDIDKRNFSNGCHPMDHL
jgi:NTE family protein